MDSRGAGPLFLAVLAALVVVYLGIAALLVFGVLIAFGLRPDPVATAGAVLASTAVVGYLSYRIGSSRILHALDAAELPREHAPNLHRRVDRLCEAMDVNRPPIYVTDLGTPNALSIGGRRPAVVVDRELLRLLAPDEIDGIVTHELAHLEGRDGLIKTLGATLLQMVSSLLFLALLPLGLLALASVRLLDWLLGRRSRPLVQQVAAVQTGTATTVILLLFALTAALRAYSRRRELAADERAASVTGQPLALAEALAKIQRAADRQRGPLSSLFVQGDEEGLLTRLLATHPPMDERIARLEALEADRWHEIEIE
ncbi:MAG TPA: M48 family metalloprotease [Natrialbaceae archaeon]|nr:M48 family metalloprotease [Natrialbaceae archaeon]